MQVKKQVFETLDRQGEAGRDPRLQHLDARSQQDRRLSPAARSDVVGLHFFSPANVTKLLEIVRGEKTAKDVLATSLGIAKQIKKIGVVAGVCDGFIGNRMLNAYFRQMDFLLDEGALPQQIDRALEKFGFAMGPFRVADLAGNDIGWAIRKRLYAEFPERAFSKIPDRICELGRFGQKTRRGLVRLQARRPQRASFRGGHEDHPGGVEPARPRAPQDRATRRSSSGRSMP